MPGHSPSDHVTPHPVRRLRLERLEDRRLLAADITSDLVGFWRLDESAIGQNVVDASGQGNDGIHVNLAPPFGPTSDAAIPAGPSPQSLALDGVNDYVRVPGSASLDFTAGAFTLSAWIKPDIDDAAFHGVIGHQAGLVNRGPSLWVFGKDRLHTGFGDGTNWNSLVTPSVLDVDDWNHVVASFDGSLYRVFVNGSQVVADPRYAGRTPVPIPELSIGRVDNFFPGLVDHVRVYQRGLTSEDAVALFQESFSGGGLIGHWKLDETAVGQSVVDTSPLANPGAHVGIAAPEGPSIDVAVDEGAASRSLTLDGIDDFVRLPASGDFNLPATNFTQSIWIKPSGDNAGFNGVLGYHESLTDRAPGIWVFDDNRIHVGFGDGSQWLGFFTGSVLSTGVWNHVATTFDGTTYRVYVGGIEVASDARFAGRSPVPFRQLHVGRVDTYFSGGVDDVRLYADALSPAAIAELASPGGTVTGLIGHWRLDEAALGVAVREETGEANDGAHRNIVAPQGPSANAAVGEVPDPRSLEFDGVDDYVHVPASPVLNLSGGQFSQSVWIHPEISDNGFHGVLGYQPTRAQRAPSIWVFDQNRLHVGFGDGGEWKGFFTPSVLTPSAWNHVVTTFDGTNYNVYVDGGLVTSSTLLAGRTPFPVTQLDIGRVDNHFAGLIDDIRIYNTVLSPAEVATLFDDSRLSGLIALEVNAFSAAEGDAAVEVTFARAGGASVDATVDYTTVNASATAGEDYVETVGTLAFPAGATTVTLQIPLLDDFHGEGNETFNIAIDRVEGATLGTIRTATITLIDDDPPPGTGSGLRGEYFQNDDFTNSVLVRVDSTVDFDWGSGAPDPAIGADTFSVRWTGFVEPSFSETYTFSTTTDDGVRLFVNGQLVIDEFVNQSATEHTGTIDLLADRRYDIRMDYFENTGDAVAELRWESASQARQIVPAARLYDGTAGPPIITFAAAAFQVNEESGMATIRVFRTGATSGIVSVTVATGDGTARDGDDYTGGSEVLTFNPGETEQTYDVFLLDDELAEPNETVVLTLSDVSGGILGAQPVAVLTLIDNDPGAFETQVHTTGLVSPTALKFLPDGRMFIAEKRGIVQIAAADGTLLPTPLIDISSIVNDRQDRGLLDIEVHPDFPAEPYFYALYAYDPVQTQSETGLAGPDGAGNRVARLARYTLEASSNYTTIEPGSQRIILGTSSTWENISNPDLDGTDDVTLPDSCGPGATITDCLAIDSRSHTIGTIEFGLDGALYVSNGDGTSFGRVDPRTVRVQDLNSLSGKILRIDPLTGQGLPDNPHFNGDAFANRSKVYSLGLRNPFRFTIHPQTGIPFIGDVGWNTWEEVNTGGANSNFGWPYYEGEIGVPKPTDGYRDLDEAQAFYASGTPTVAAIHARRHSDGARAIVMGDFYDGSTFPSIYHGGLFFADVNEGTIDAIVFDAQGGVESVRRIDSNHPGVVQMTSGTDGDLYLVNIGLGQIERFAAVSQPTTSGPVEHRLRDTIRQHAVVDGRLERRAGGELDVTATDAAIESAPGFTAASSTNDARHSGGDPLRGERPTVPDRPRLRGIARLPVSEPVLTLEPAVDRILENWGS